MFLFKRIVSSFIFPLPLCLEMLLVGLALLWFTRLQRAGKILVSAGTILLLSISYPFVPNLALRPLEKSYPPVSYTTASQPASNGDQAIKWIVVLGAGHISDPKLPVTSQITTESLYRVLEGVRLYKARPGRKLILSAGGDPIPTSQVMAQVALIMGVNPEDIIQEAASWDTEEEARLIKPMVGQDGFFLVTSASHMPRSMAIFHKVGLAPVAAPAGHLVRQDPNRSPRDFFPSSGAINKMETALYEYLGLTWAWLRGVI
jgi:uncharacterized SAM-binding protein YcdF (DUF218 family)